MKSYINIVNLSKRYASNILLDSVNLLIEEKSKIGMIGRNGAGKTTLLKILMGTEEADSGEVVLSDSACIGYLRQVDDFDDSENVIAYLERTTLKEGWRCAKMAARFGIDYAKSKLSIGSLSSGFRMRVKLTEMMLYEPNFLLLDEPSNFLDLNTLIDLENFLLDYNGGFLIVSHDREFLKSTCEKTIEVELGKCTYFPGPIEDYFEYKASQFEYIKRYNRNIEDKKAHLQKFVDRFKYKQSKASAAQSKMKQIERLQNIEIKNPSKNIKIRIPEVSSKKGFALISDALNIGYGTKVVAKSNRIEVARGAHVAVLGENGQGKTTLLRTLSGELASLSGSYQYAQGLKVAYFAEHIYKDISAHGDVLSYLRRYAKQGLLTQELLTLLGSFLFSGDDVYKNVNVLSGGEKSRLTLLASITQCADVLLLDEPTNHLDFETVEALAMALSNYNGTIFFTSHDRTFASMLADTIIEVKNGQIYVYEGDYDAYVYHLKLLALQEQERKYDYTLETNLENRNANKEQNKADIPQDKFQVTDYAMRKKIKNKISKCETNIKNIEVSIEKYKTEEAEVIRIFETATEYNEANFMRLGELKTLISEAEAAWFIAHEELEKSVLMLEC